MEKQNLMPVFDLLVPTYASCCLITVLYNLSSHLLHQLLFLNIGLHTLGQNLRALICVDIISLLSPHPQSPALNFFI